MFLDFKIKHLTQLFMNTDNRIRALWNQEVLPKNGLLPICLTEVQILMIQCELSPMVYHKDKSMVHFYF